jgi:ABC-type transport system substrate-binding protein
MHVFPLIRQAMLGGITIFTLLVIAIGPARATPTPAGVLVWPDVGIQWPYALDPALTVLPTDEQIINLLYNGLVKLDGHNNVVPDLAEAMPTISADRRTYTFTLHPHLQFSDGTPLTAADVVYSLSRGTSKREASTVASYLHPIKGFAAWNAGKAASLTGVRALDSRTVQITLDKPATFFLAALTIPLADVVKRDVAAGEDLVGSGAQARNIGAGPWIFAGPWRYRQEMDFTPNPHWYRAGQLKLAEIRVPFVSSVDTNYREYLAGQDPVAVVPTAHVAADRALPDFHAGTALETDFVAMNQGSDSQCKPVSCAPFNNLHFRRALLYAVDRQTITQKILHGTEAPLCSFVPQGLAGYDPGLCARTPYDPAGARRELALARQDFGGTLPNQNQLTLTYPSTSQDLGNEVQELQVEWQAVGITVRLVAMPWNALISVVLSGTDPFNQGGWNADYADPQDFTEAPLSFNTTHYHNPAFDRLMALADGTPNGPERSNLYVQAQKILIDDVVTIAIGQTVWSYRWRPTIHGLFVSSIYIWPMPLNEDWTNVWIS